MGARRLCPPTQAGPYNATLLAAEGSPVVGAIEHGQRDLWLATERCIGPAVFPDGFEAH